MKSLIAAEDKEERLIQSGCLRSNGIAHCRYGTTFSHSLDPTRTFPTRGFIGNIRSEYACHSGARTMLARVGQVLYWTACAVVACGLGLARPALAGEDATVIVATAMADGSLELEGVRYTNPDMLKEKVAEIKARNPTPQVQVRSQNGTGERPARLGVMMLERAGLHSTLYRPR